VNFFKYIPTLFFVGFCGNLAIAQDASDSALENKLFSTDSAEAGEDLSSEAAPTRDTSDELPSIVEAESPKEKKSEKDLKALDEALKGPKQIPFSHILVVQNRYVKKEGKHEIMPAMVGVQPGDSFRRQLQWGFSYTYHFTEDFGIEALHVAFITSLKTGLSDTIRDSTSLETYREEPVVSLGSTLQWTPLHSKAATADSVYRFEGYFLGGGGMTKMENTSAGLAMAGLGIRAYFEKRSIFKVELRDYIDFRGGSQQRLNVVVGASILLGGGT